MRQESLAHRQTGLRAGLFACSTWRLKSADRNQHLQACTKASQALFRDYGIDTAKTIEFP
ncbi:MAG: hypothetical protein H7338_21425 [Candidatus Sericytochromatia bacterium]|nr:hypothetical protein [Candidatus Sericytochromatia bacterium]